MLCLIVHLICKILKIWDKINNMAECNKKIKNKLNRIDYRNNKI